MQKMHTLRVGGGTSGYIFSVVHVNGKRTHTQDGAGESDAASLSGYIFSAEIYNRKNRPTRYVAWSERVYLFRR